jgi:hypothetical protein
MLYLATLTWIAIPQSLNTLTVGALGTPGLTCKDRASYCVLASQAGEEKVLMFHEHLVCAWHCSLPCDMAGNEADESLYSWNLFHCGQRVSKEGDKHV